MADTETKKYLSFCPFCGRTDLDPTVDGVFQLTDGYKWGAVVCCIRGPEVQTAYKELDHWRQAAIDAWEDRTPPITEETTETVDTHTPSTNKN